MHFRHYFILPIALITLSFSNLKAQQKSKVEIIQADALEYKESIIANAQRLIGNVVLRHKDVMMYCDSAYSYDDKNEVDAFGSVHITRGDTLHLYGDLLNYNEDLRLAKVRNHVKLVDNTTQLTTDSLDFNLETNVGYYNYGAKIVDSTNVLTSTIGEYYTDGDFVLFKNDVILENPDYRLESDTLRYHTITQKATILGPTDIYSEDMHLYSEDGWYETQEGVSHLYQNSMLEQESHSLRGDTIVFDRDTKTGELMGGIELRDTSNHIFVTGNHAIYSEQTEIAVVTDSAIFHQYDKVDTLFLHADTLRMIPDVDKDEKVIQAFYGVRFFRNDMQGKCDSLVYWSADSTLQMFHDPVLWTFQNQMSARNVEMRASPNEPDSVLLSRDAFIVSKEDEFKYNQVRGRDMIGFLKQNELYQIDVNGNAETIYYVKEEEDVIGVNKSEGSQMIIHINDRQFEKITFLDNPMGIIQPTRMQEEGDKELKGFSWREDIRPQSPADIFQEQAGTPAVDQPTMDTDQVKSIE